MKKRKKKEAGGMYVADGIQRHHTSLELNPPL